MRILIDLRCLQSPPPRGGVGVFAERITRALIARANAECPPGREALRAGGRMPSGPRGPQSRWQNAECPEFIIFANGLIEPRHHLPQFDSPNARWVIGRWPNKVFSLFALLPCCPAALLPTADVVFLPNLNFLSPLPKRTKLVVTVHDLSFEHFADCFTWKQRLWHRFVRPRKLLQRADAIIAVSETTKRDVVETYGIPDEKVHVVYPGIEHSNATNTDSNAPNLKHSDVIRNIRMFTPFILSISELSPRKNLDGLIAAFEQLIAYDLQLTAPLHLVIAGNHGSAERAIRRQIARSPARNRIHLIGPVTENEKHALLARASCFVYPSLWEGFGFPPLEAMAAGVPVVASTGGSLPEILGECLPRRMTGAALLVDPLDPAAIADAIARVLTDDTLRTDLIARGRERAARYRWDDTANRVLDVLASA